jgi:hypothetical protein
MFAAMRFIFFEEFSVPSFFPASSVLSFFHGKGFNTEDAEKSECAERFAFA